MENKKRAIADKSMIMRAIKDSFTKLSPKTQAEPLFPPHDEYV